MYIRVLNVSKVLFLWAWVGASSAQTPSEHFQLNSWFGEYGRPGAQRLNPAGMVESDYTDISSGIITSSGEGAQMGYFSIVNPAGYNHSFGLTFFSNIQPPEPLRRGAPYLQRALQLGYGRRMGAGVPFSHLLSAGVNVSIFEFDTSRSSSYLIQTADIGLSLNPLSSSRFGNTQIGFAFQNALQSEMKSSLDPGTYSVPGNFVSGLFWRSPMRRWEVSAALAVLNIAYSRAQEREMQSGGSVVYFTERNFGIRAACSPQGYASAGGIMNFVRMGGFPHLRFEADFSHDRLSFGNTGDYAYITLKVSAGIGTIRSLRLEPARFRRLKLEPDGLEGFSSARKKFEERRYFDAILEFGSLLRKHPDHNFRDTSVYYMARAFEALELDAAAEKLYFRMLAESGDAGLRSEAAVRLMGLDIKAGRIRAAEEKYLIIAPRIQRNSISSRAEYLMGQVCRMRGDRDGCISLLGCVPAGSGDYLKAQYALARCYLEKHDDQNAADALRKVISADSAGPDDRELKNSAFVKLGQLMMDASPPRPADAYAAFNRVDTDSPDEDEALAGMAGAAFSMNRFGAADTAASILIRKFPESPFTGEGFYLKGRIRFLMHDYPAALELLHKSETVLRSIPSGTSAELTKTAYEKNLRKWEGLGRDLYENASAGLRADHAWKKNDSIRGEIELYLAEKHRYDGFLLKTEKTGRNEPARARVLARVAALREEIETSMGENGGMDISPGGAEK